MKFLLMRTAHRVGIRNLLGRFSSFHLSSLKELTDRNEAVENKIASSVRKANGGRLKMLNWQDNGEDEKAKKTQR